MNVVQALPPKRQPKPTEQAQVKKVVSTFDHAKTYAQSKIAKNALHSFTLAVFAGLFIGLAFVFYITVTTGAGDAPWGLVRLSGGLAFSMGLMLVVVCGGELFTSTVLSVIAWFQKQVSTKELLKCWARVYVGNFIGASLLIALVLVGGMHSLAGGEWGANAIAIAQHKLHHGWWQAFSLGVLCNLLVCLAIWMTFTAKDQLAKSMLMILPVAMFVSSGFEHSIANLFMVPLAMGIKTVASPELLATMGFSLAQLSDLSWSNFIVNNLIPVTLGNIVGGAVLVAFGFWIADKASHNSEQQIDTAKTPTLKLISSIPTLHDAQQSGDTTMNTIAKKTVTSIMQENALMLNPEMSIQQALTAFVDHDLRSAPVVDNQHRLVGYLSEQDILRFYWSEEYQMDSNWLVKDMMQTEVMTLSPADSLDALVELMCVDRETLFPVSDTGVFTGGSYQSYEQRLRRAVSSKPSHYPVVKDGYLVGMVNRHSLLKALAQTSSKEELSTPIQQQTCELEASGAV
ncbi:formate transporter FocA [Alginatibacterium sediminis]|uniref:Formate transporter FocA n=1 Tax=Alginatibacterium sediminis TaxID=2164068 RepID=A0A420E845_9ALTE|nr:formate transporter FocA [Alginatibacterium sediminis]RKF15699.1 formate transporter FocA [Alginatibacterium sediminis]